ncbi:MAG: GAF domain-containing sensor histidine kinase, partial [Bryobacteraceae bacterium]
MAGTACTRLPALATAMVRGLFRSLEGAPGLPQAQLARLDSQLGREWQTRGLGPKERKALSAVTPVAAAALLAQRRPLVAFFEQVDYHGRRLAKLDVAPAVVARAVRQAGRLLADQLRRLDPGRAASLEALWRQFELAILLVLHHAYYRVREAEAETFQQLFRAELLARNHAELIERCLAILARWSGADAARFYLLDRRERAWVLGGAWPPREPGAAPAWSAVLACRLSRPRLIARVRDAPALVLEPQWRTMVASCWSVPLMDGKRLEGVLQFGFAKQYEWLPGELRLLRLAAELIREASRKARMAEELAAREEQIRRLAEQMVHVEEAERRRISEELHDEAGQSLLCLRLRLEMLEQEAAGLDGRLRAGLAEARRMVEHSIEEVRRLVADLSPAVLEHMGLKAAIRRLVARFEKSHGIPVSARFRLEGGIPKRLERVVYRLVQECLNNAGKHSRARRVNLSLDSDDKGLRLRVEDNGVGFRVPEVLASSRGFGLAGMQERVG